MSERALTNPKLKFIQIGISRHGRKVVYFRRAKGKRIRLPHDLNSKEFRLHYDAALRGDPLPIARLPSWHEQRTRKALVLAKRALKGAVWRSSRKGLKLDITREWIISQIEMQHFKCALTGLPFSFERGSTSKVNPFLPSLDRIDPEKGYTQDNVRVVIFAINAMMLDWGESIFATVADAYVGTKGEQSIPPPEGNCALTL